MGSPAFAMGARNADRDTSAEIRRELARELHDRVVQTLTTMLIELETFKAEHTGNRSVVSQLDGLQESTRDVLDNMRRVLYSLRDDEATPDGFADAVRTLLARFQERTRIAVNLSVAPGWPSTIRPSAAHNLYRIIEESLTNVRMHSGAESVRVSLHASEDDIAVEVRDDGKGASADGRGHRPGLGVMGMRERALLLGGRLEMESVDGRGTTIRAILPKEQLI